MVRRRRSPWRALLIVPAVIVLALIGVAAAALLLIDTDSLKPRIVAAVSRATGRDIVIAGRLGLEPTWPPTVSAENVVIADPPGANPPGETRPAMARVRRVEAQFDPLPLLVGQIAIERLVLLQPDILVETDARGVSNWRRPASQTAEPAAAGPGTPALPGAASGGQAFSVQAIHLRDGKLTWRDARRALAVSLDIARLDGTAPSRETPVALSGEGRLGGAAFTLTAQTGPLSRLFDRHATTPWPIQLTLSTPGVPDAPTAAAPGTPGDPGVVVATGAGGRMTVSGTMDDPAGARRYDLAIDAAAADLGTLAPAGAGLPHVRNVFLTGHIKDTGAALPELSQVKLLAGAADLSAFLPGLLLDRADLEIPGLTEGTHAELHGTLSGATLDVVADLGALRQLLPGWVVPGTEPAADAGAFPIEVAAGLGGMKLTAKGGIPAPATLTGLDLEVRASIADSGELGSLTGRTLPTLRDLAFSGRIADGPGGYAKGISLTGATLTLPQGDLSGDATLRFADPPRLQATLASKRLDLDALRTALAPLPGAVAPPPAAPPAEAPAKTAFLDRAFPLAALGLGDADVSVTLAELRAGGAVFHDIAGHAVLQAGKLTLDPFAAETPSGTLEATLSVDAAPDAPPVALTLHAPGLVARQMLALFGLPDDANGRLEIDADLHGTGRTARALLAGLDGRLGLGMVDGDIDNRVLATLVGDVLRAAKLPSDIGGAGRTKLRCFALRLDATKGNAAIGALVLDTSKLLVQGSGTVSLADDGLALRLRPVMRLGAGPGLAVPVRIGGTLREPKFAVDVAGSIEATLATAAGLQGGRGVSPSGADRNGDLCPLALAAARDGHAGALPSAGPGGTAAAIGTALGAIGRANPAEALRRLVR